MTATAVLEAPAEVAAPAGRKWLGLFALLSATLMNLLDSSIVGVAAPAIRTDLGGTYASLQWIAAGYTLALAVGLLTGGRLGDLYGRKPMLMVGIVGFLAASLACAAAPNPGTLIAARVLQGLFGAAMIPQTFGLIRDLFGPKEIGKAFAAFGPVIGLSTILGPVVAGLLVDADVLGSGWRMIFLINLPLGGFALVAGFRALPARHRADRPTRLDVPGALLAGAGMFLLVYPLVQGRELGWPLWSLAMLAGSAPVLAGFVAHQVWRKRTGGTPLVELSVFAQRSYASGVGFVLVFFGAVVGFSLAVGLFLQLGLGYTPTKASLTMATWAFGAFVGSAFGGTVGARLGRRILHLGLVGMGAGIGGLYLTFRAAAGGSGVELGGWSLGISLLVFGTGMGMIFVPLFGIIMGGVADHEVGSASSMLEAVQQLGASLGVAVLGTVFFGVIGAQAHHNFDTHAAPRLRVELASTADADRTLAGVRACLHDRENATDPDVLPASCAASGAPSAPVLRAALDTHRRDALDAAGRVTLLTLGLTSLAFGLGFLLPRGARNSPDQG